MSGILFRKIFNVAAFQSMERKAITYIPDRIGYILVVRESLEYRTVAV
jgi:hypothetical protein